MACRQPERSALDDLPDDQWIGPPLGVIGDDLTHLRPRGKPFAKCVGKRDPSMVSDDCRLVHAFAKQIVCPQAVVADSALDNGAVREPNFHVGLDVGVQCGHERSVLASETGPGGDCSVSRVLRKGREDGVSEVLDDAPAVCHHSLAAVQVEGVHELQ